MQPVTIRDIDFKVISISRNLSGLLRHARHSPVTRADTWGAMLGVTFADGASCVTHFADPAVLKGWLAARVKLSRGWACATITHHTL